MYFLYIIFSTWTFYKKNIYYHITECSTSINKTVWICIRTIWPTCFQDIQTCTLIPLRKYCLCAIQLWSEWFIPLYFGVYSILCAVVLAVQWCLELTWIPEQVSDPILYTHQCLLNWLSKDVCSPGRLCQSLWSKYNAPNTLLNSEVACMGEW